MTIDEIQPMNLNYEQSESANFFNQGLFDFNHGFDYEKSEMLLDNILKAPNDSHQKFDPTQSPEAPG